MDLSALSQLNTFGAPTLEGFDLNNARPGERIRGSARQFVRFYKKKFLEMVASKVSIAESGEVRPLGAVQPKEREIEMVHVITPGDKNEYDGEATEYHKREFWPQYKAYKDGKTIPLGLSIDECTFIIPSVATELRYLGVHTCEQLADASDDLANRVPDGWMLREYARAQCKVNLTNKSLDQVNLLRGELEKSQTIIKEMQKQMGEMKGMILNAKGEEIPTEEIQAIKKSPGRPKKTLDTEN